jgi:hypothetical protein
LPEKTSQSLLTVPWHGNLYIWRGLGQKTTINFRKKPVTHPPLGGGWQSLKDSLVRDDQILAESSLTDWHAEGGGV